MDISTKIKAHLQVIQAILDIVREAKEIPAGTLYARLMEFGCTMEQYERVERLLLDTGRVEKRGNLLIWKGDNPCN